MEPVTSGGGERSNTGGIQEKIGQPLVIYALTWIPALSRGLDSMALQAPSKSIILRFHAPYLPLHHCLNVNELFGMAGDSGTGGVMGKAYGWRA